MGVLLFDHSEALAAWCASQIGHAQGGFGACQAIGVASGTADTDKLYAVVVFHDYQPRFGTIQVSAAARTAWWATPSVMRGLLAYPFMQLRVFKLWVAIPHDNRRALRFNLGIGMKREGILRHHFGEGRHAVICGMTRPEYWRSRWAPIALRKAA